MSTLLATVAACVGLYLLWIVGHLVAMATVPHNVPVFTGFRVVIPPWVLHLLTLEQLRAIIAHEHGHRHHRHVWKNFARFCFFLPVTPERIQQQELEADDYAVRLVHPLALAAALRRMPCDEFALVRIRRLIDIAWNNHAPFNTQQAQENMRNENC